MLRPQKLKNISESGSIAVSNMAPSNHLLDDISGRATDKPVEKSPGLSIDMPPAGNTMDTAPSSMDQDVETGEIPPETKSILMNSTLDTTVPLKDELDTSEHSTLSGGSSSTSSSVSFARNQLLQTWKLGLAALILLVGACTSAVFLSSGILNEQEEKSSEFDRRADEFVDLLKNAFKDYELFGLWIHESCRARERSEVGGLVPLGTCSRQDFRELYEHISSVGLEFQSAQYMPYVAQADRAAVEAEARDFYGEHYPNVTYRGIVGLFPTEEGGLTVLPQDEKDFYWPVHYIEPVEGNEKAIDLDIYSSPSQQKTIDHAVRTWLPSVTDRIKLVQETEPNAFSIILHHPGIRLSTHNETDTPSGISLMVIRIPTLIAHTTEGANDDKAALYIYDATYEDEEPVFLGGNTFCGKKKQHVSEALPEISLNDLEDTTKRSYELRELEIADRKWIIAVVSLSDAYEPETTNVIVGGVTILLASVMLSICFWLHMNRIANMNAVKAKAAREKADVIVQAARKQARTEREVHTFVCL